MFPLTPDPSRDRDPLAEARTVDFQALIPKTFTNPGLVVYLRRAVRLDGGKAFYVAEIARRRLSGRGEDLKPEPVISICGQEGAPLPELLRDLARLFEQEAPVEFSP